MGRDDRLRPERHKLKMSEFTFNNKIQQIVERYDCPRLEEIHKEKKNSIYQGGKNEVSFIITNSVSKYAPLLIILKKRRCFVNFIFTCKTLTSDIWECIISICDDLGQNYCTGQEAPYLFSGIFVEHILNYKENVNLKHEW